MLEEGWGRIVNISSSSVHSGSRGLSSYVSAKSGVVGLTKCLALEFSPHGITVNTIPPGFIDTPMLRQTMQSGFFSLEQQIAKTPVRRIGQPEDVAAACAFLVSDGGQLHHRPDHRRQRRTEHLTRLSEGAVERSNRAKHNFSVATNFR